MGTGFQEAYFLIRHSGAAVNSTKFSGDTLPHMSIEGRPVIKPDDLEDADTEESSVLEHRGYAESIQASRDNIKIRKKSQTHGAEFSLLGTCR